MKLENKSPKTDGFYMPAEFAPQRGCILIWPERPGSWPYGAVEARKTFTELILNLAKGEEVFVLANPEVLEQARQQIFETAEAWYATVEEADAEQIEADAEQADAEQADLEQIDLGQTDLEQVNLEQADTDQVNAEHVDRGQVTAKRINACSVEEIKSRIHILEIPNNDAWARDTAPTFVTNGSEVRGISWTFNAWGGEFDGLYADWEKDDALAPAFCEQTGYDWYDEAPFVLEGGSIHSDGEGTVLVTEACLLSGGRNPSMTKEQITEKLKDTLGAEKVIWLPNGIYNDETNEHVDNVCAFTAPGEVVLAWTEEKEDPQYQMSLEDLQVLESETDAKGRSFKVRRILVPKEHVCINEYELAGLDAEEGEDERECGERLAASYVNFYIGNACVLVPQFGDVNDASAIATLKECFPEREIVPIQARSLIVGGGNIHCVTQQIPM